jgi:hypothetical protein
MRASALVAPAVLSLGVASESNYRVPRVPRTERETPCLKCGSRVKNAWAGMPHE